jgi:hypothetical protein
LRAGAAVEEAPWYFVGLDLGQSQDHSALAVVEHVELIQEDRDAVTYERRRERRCRVRFLERVALGTSYPAVVERVRTVVRRGAVAGRCTLVMDATGVGAAVLDLLRGAGLGCGIEPVILTGGERERYKAGAWRLPKRDLITGLRVMLEKRELGLSRRVAGADLLARELGAMASRATSSGRVSFGAWQAGEHDDLVVATALACWRARRKSGGIWGTRSLGL